MIAVIFEVWPKPERRQEYLDLAAALRRDLEAIDGFISVERFESLSEPGKLLSSRSGATRRRSPHGAILLPTERRRGTDALGFSPTTGCGWRASSGTTA